MAQRYFCSTCQGRVSPYDSREELTLSPNGEDILLKSFNDRRRAGGDALMAWCFGCRSWVEAEGLDRLELAYRYWQRQGVSFRFDSRSKRAFAEELEARRQRRAYGIASLPRPARNGRVADPVSAR